MEAVEAYGRAADLGDLEARLNIADLLAHELDRLDEGTTLYRAIAKDGDKRGLTGLGTLFLELGRRSEAEPLLREAISAGEARAHLQLGLLLHEDGHTEDALVELRRAAELGVKGAGSSLAFAFAGLDRSEDAFRHCEQPSRPGKRRPMPRWARCWARWAATTSLRRSSRRHWRRGRTDVFVEYGNLLVELEGRDEDAEV